MDGRAVDKTRSAVPRCETAWASRPKTRASSMAETEQEPGPHQVLEQEMFGGLGPEGSRSSTEHVETSAFLTSASQSGMHAPAKSSAQGIVRAVESKQDLPPAIGSLDHEQEHSKVEVYSAGMEHRSQAQFE